MQPLTSSVNRFNGIDIDPASLPQSPEHFAAALRHSLRVWGREGRRVVWLMVPIQQSRLIPVAVDAGFTFHHAGSEYLMLTRALDDHACVPGHATHYIGAGGVVVNDQDELLVVVEQYRRNRGQAPRYKLPGGALHPSEHLSAAVVREVREETGVDTEFQSLICFRHWHGYRFGKSDIYFVCRLRPLTHRLRRQEEEIAECRWMPLREYLQEARVSAFNRHVVQAALESPGMAVGSIEGYEDAQRYEIFMPAAQPSG